MIAEVGESDVPSVHSVAATFVAQRRALALITVEGREQQWAALYVW